MRNVFILGVLLLALIFTSTADYHEQETLQDQYCEMVAQWEASDLPPGERPGWPPYKGACDGPQQR